jgi:hypothetical protein
MKAEERDELQQQDPIDAKTDKRKAKPRLVDSQSIAVEARTS